MRRTSTRTLIAVMAVCFALVSAVPATAATRNPRPTEAQATAIAKGLAERAADGLRSFGIFDIEHMSVSCGRPLGWGPRSLTCVYMLYVHNTQDGSGQMCLNNHVQVFKTRAGRLLGRAGSLSCF